MSNVLASLIPQKSYEEILESAFSFGKYGMIISKEFDHVICLPEQTSTSRNIIKGHVDSIRLTFKILYKKYLPLFHRNINIIKTKAPNYIAFVDNAEMIYAIFLASIGEITFLDSTEGQFLSGCLFLPDDLHMLTPSQIEVTYHFLETVYKKVETQKEKPIYEAMMISSFESEKPNYTYKSFYEIKKEIDFLYKNTKGKSIS